MAKTKKMDRPLVRVLLQDDHPEKFRWNWAGDDLRPDEFIAMVQEETSKGIELGYVNLKCMCFNYDCIALSGERPMTESEYKEYISHLIEDAAENPSDKDIRFRLYSELKREFET